MQNLREETENIYSVYLIVSGAGVSQRFLAGSIVHELHSQERFDHFQQSTH